jgi:hypothetical protein
MAMGFICNGRDPSLPHLYILIMDFTELDHSLQRIASQHHLPVETTLERWLERRAEMNDPNAWKELDGIPCIVAGLAALLGKCCG